MLRELLALHERERELHLNFLEFDSRGPAVVGAPAAAEHIRLLSQLLCEEFLNLPEREIALHAQVLSARCTRWSMAQSGFLHTIAIGR